MKKTNNKVVFENCLYDIYKGKNDIAKKRIRNFVKDNNKEYKYIDYSWIKYLMMNSGSNVNILQDRTYHNISTTKEYIDGLNDIETDIKI